MNLKIQLLRLAVSLILFGLAVPAAKAQILQAELKVKGLACPFCAYGLERKLKKLPGAKAVEVLMNQDTAKVQFDGEHSPAIDDFARVVHGAGFKLGELRLTLLAKRSAYEGTPCFELRDGQVLFLGQEGRSRILVDEVAEGTLVRVTGTVQPNKAKGHHAHPHTLSVESFQVRRQEGKEA